MPFIPTPGYYASRARLYHQLAQLTAAGITLPAAVEMQQRNPPSRSLRAALGVMLPELQRGATFSDALQAASQWVPRFDIALLHAGEHSGRLPTCFKLLSDHYDNSAQLLRQVISGLAYPALLLHVAVLLGPLPSLVLTGNVIGYLTKVLSVLVPIYAIVLVVAWLTGSDHGRWTAGVQGFLRYVPILGRARHNLAVARLSSALEALISAGVPIFKAWDLAGDACGSARLSNAVQRWKPLFENGVTPAEALADSPEFPEVFSSLYRTGEVTGSLDDTLRRLQVLHQEEGTRQMKAFAEWTPKLVYFGIVFFIALQVIRFWTGYFNSVSQVF